MKRTFIMLLCISLTISVYSFDNDTLKVNNGLGFSIKIEGVYSDIFITNINNQNAYGAGQLTITSVNLGIYYKGFGINYSPPFLASSGTDYYTDNYSDYAGFQTFYYANWWGVDIYSQKFNGYFVGDEDMLEYRPDWELSEDGFHWAQEMKSKNQSINIYGKILGKQKLSDYFFQPTLTRKSKVGLFGLVSLDKQNVYDTEGLFIPEAELDYPELTDGFDYNQISASAGLGASGTLFIKNFYFSTALAVGYTYSKIANSWSTGNFNGYYFDWDLLNLKVFTGLQAKMVQFELGYVNDFCSGNINDNYELQYSSTFVYAKLSVRFPTK